MSPIGFLLGLPYGNLGPTLRVEASCSVCLGYLRDPVLLECGHNFCRSCITRWWAELARDLFPCPVCRKTSRRRALRPNRQLANMVEAARQLRGPKRKAENPESCCPLHGQALRRFCRDDQAPACLACEISRVLGLLEGFWGGYQGVWGGYEGFWGC
uniref:RING-type domain-containing protein n=1 Tax=Cairina moschata TaxID=8855 RepID=A0A8C3CCX2_CAIMO